MIQENNDKRFMGLAGARIKPPGEFLTDTLKYLAKGWFYGLIAMAISPLPIIRHFVVSGAFWVPAWALTALLAISLIAANFYYGYLTKQPDHDAMYIYAPKVRPYLMSLLAHVAAATVILFFLFSVVQYIRPVTADVSFVFPNPWTLVLLAYPFGATYLLLGEFRTMHTPHIWLCIQAWTYCLPGVPTTANTTARDLRKQILGRKDVFNGRHWFLTFAFFIFSIILFWSLLEVFEYGFVFFMSPYFSLWSLGSTLAVVVIPVVKEVQDARVGTEDEEHHQLQITDDNTVFGFETVVDQEAADV